jgi:hypothetical protein
MEVGDLSPTLRPVTGENMTKHIRIENADRSDHKVRVYAETKQADGTWLRANDTPEAALDYPTEMHTGVIWAQRRLVVEEA